MKYVYGLDGTFGSCDNVNISVLIKLSSFLGLRSSISSILFMNSIYATYIKGIKI